MKKSPVAGIAASLLVTILLATPGRADEPKTPLAQEMMGIAKDVRSLHKMVNDPAQKDAAIGLIKDMESHAAKARDMDPASAKTVAASDRDQYLADYKKQIDGLIADMQKLGQAVTDGKTADAASLLDKLGADKRQGHQKFNKDTDHGPGGPHKWQNGPGGGPGGPGGPPPAPPAQSGTGTNG